MDNQNSTSNIFPDLVTVLLLAYNHERFIAEAVESIFQQNYPHLQIVLSDDCSNDRTFDIMLEMTAAYEGSHRITLNHNEQNLGVIGHYNKIMKTAKGQFIVAAAGDDISAPNRVSRLVQEWKKGRAVVFGCNPVLIDEYGKTGNRFMRSSAKYVSWQDMIHHNHSRIFLNAWDRSVFDLFGDLPDNTRNEDQIIPFRGALISGAHNIDEPLIRYRTHGGNLSFWIKERSASTPERLELRKRALRNHCLNLQNWLGALDQAHNKGLVSQRDSISGRNGINQQIELLNLEVDLLELPIMARLKKARAVWSLSKDAKDLVRKAILVLSPNLYSGLGLLANKISAMTSNRKLGLD